MRNENGLERWMERRMFEVGRISEVCLGALVMRQFVMRREKGAYYHTTVTNTCLVNSQQTPRSNNECDIAHNEIVLQAE